MCPSCYLVVVTLLPTHVVDVAPYGDVSRGYGGGGVMGVIVALTITLPYFELDLALRTVEELHLIPQEKLFKNMPCSSIR